MLRINLLPPYIYEGNKRRNVTILWVVILALVIGGAVYAKATLDAQTRSWNEQRAQQEPIMAEAQRTQSEADKIKNENAVLKSKRDFVAGALEHNRSVYPNTFDNVKNYTIQRVLYSAVIPAGQQINITAFAPTLADVGHYMLAMEQNPNISGLAIGINSIPSFPLTPQSRPQPVGMRPPGHDFTATLMLNTPIPAGPTYPPGGQAGGARPAGGMGAPSMGGMGSPYGGGGPPPGAMMGPMGGGGSPYGGAPAGPGGSSAMMGSGGMMRGGAAGGQQGDL